MPLPVDTLEFWDKRIKDAHARGHKFWSVYITREGDWLNITNEHRRVLDQEITPGDRILDAGCGYGRWAEYFNPHKYMGVDFSPEFIRIAKMENPKHRFVVSKLESMPFKDKEFDVAFCISIREMIINNLGQKAWDLMEEELKRVSKKVLILEYTDPEKYEVL